MKPRNKIKKNFPKRKPLVRRVFGWIFTLIIAFYFLIAILLCMLRWVDPPFTAVQLERPYPRHYHFVPMSRISLNIQHAVVSAEDTRFFQHHGFDWKEMGHAVEQDFEEGRKRGASTITQQLVRNLFLNTSPSVIRKLVEISIVPLTELILTKNRILELYLNVIEYGPGIYGCEVASHTYFGVSAAAVSRDQAVKLAEILPAPLHWKPGQKPKYGERISLRMHQAGW